MATLGRVLLFVRDVHTSTAFWSATGLAIHARTATWTRFAGPSHRAGGAELDLLEVADEAALCTSYAPVLQLTVDSVAAAVPRLLALGARLDGGIEHTEAGAIATVRTPDGHTISLVEALR